MRDISAMSVVSAVSAVYKECIHPRERCACAATVR